MRRFLATSTAFLAMTGTLLVLPVYAAPVAAPEPVEVTTEEVALGSFEAPAAEAEVQEGTRDPVPGVGATTPTLTVEETGTDEFSMVAVSWAYDPAVTDTVVQVRVQDEDGDWGGWAEVGTEEAAPDPGADPTGWRGGTSPLWTGPSHGVQAEVVTRAGAQPTDVQLTLVDPGESEADAVVRAPDITDTAEAALAMPPVFSRAQWGADESKMTWSPQLAPTLKAATLHHTASGNGYAADDVPAILRGIYHTHAVTNGWGDLGYNVLVDRFGRIWEGRAGGLAKPVIGAHAGGWNTGTFGVSMLGNYDTVDTPQAMVDSVAAVIAWKLSLYGIDPTGSTQLTGGGAGTSRYPAGTSITVPTVFAHSEVGKTACPGRYGYARLPEIRRKAMGRAANQSFVRALYRDMMVRDADEPGLAGWTTTLTGGGGDRRTVARGFSNSHEYRNLIVEQAYAQVLGRAPDPGGRSYWIDALARGAVRLDSLRTTLMSSEEFYLRGGSSDAQFVDNIYQAALGRGAGPSEVAYWAPVRRRSGPQAVIAAVWGSPEAGMRRVDQLYRYYLGRTAGGVEQQYWLPVVAGSGDEQLREEIVVSAEYFARAGGRFPS